MSTLGPWPQQPAIIDLWLQWRGQGQELDVQGQSAIKSHYKTIKYSSYKWHNNTVWYILFLFWLFCVLLSVYSHFALDEAHVFYFWTIKWKWNKWVLRFKLNSTLSDNQHQINSLWCGRATLENKFIMNNMSKTELLLHCTAHRLAYMQSAPWYVSRDMSPDHQIHMASINEGQETWPGHDLNIQQVRQWGWWVDSLESKIRM